MNGELTVQYGAEEEKKKDVIIKGKIALYNCENLH